MSEQETIDSLYASTFGASPETQEASNESAVSYSFDEDFQRKIAALFVRDNKFAKQTAGLIKPEYFESQAQGFLFSIFSDYYDLYRSVPTDLPTIRQVLGDAFDKRKIRAEMRTEVVEEFKRLRACSIADGEFVKKKVSEFAQHQSMTNFFADGIEHLEKGNLAKILEMFEKVKRIGTSEQISELDFYDDVERRTERRKDELEGNSVPQGITSGIRDLDRHLYHKGWGRKELSCIMGGAKRGKSMGLGHFAVAASKAGFNVLYVTLEVSAEIIAERMDANVTKTAMYDLSDNMIAVQNEVKRYGAQKNRGVLKIVEFPTGTLSPGGLRRLIDRYRNEGIVFDLILPDYADIMRPDHVTNDSIENSKSIWVGLRAIASEENAAVLTATQTNRTGFKSDVAKAEDVAEDFNKIRIADLVISINRTDEERDKKEARLYMAATRNGEGEITLKIKQDLPSMQFITEVTNVS